MSYFKEKILTQSLFIYDKDIRFATNDIKPDIDNIPGVPVSSAHF